MEDDPLFLLFLQLFSLKSVSGRRDMKRKKSPSSATVEEASLQQE